MIEACFAAPATDAPHVSRGRPALFLFFEASPATSDHLPFPNRHYSSEDNALSRTGQYKLGVDFQLPCQQPLRWGYGALPRTVSYDMITSMWDSLPVFFAETL